MISVTYRKLSIPLGALALTMALGLPSAQADGSRRVDRDVRMIEHWNQIAIDMSGLDHAPVPAGDPRIFGEALGPVRSSRAMAIVHIAVFEAVNAIEGGFKSYVGLPRVQEWTSMQAAVAQAAHDTLVAMFPSQTAACDEALADELRGLRKGEAFDNGIELGRQAAAAILAMRENDGSSSFEPMLGVDYFPSDAPGQWRQDPIRQIPIALGAFSAEVAPFVTLSNDQFRVPPPPALDSDEYTEAFNEVKRLGGDGVNTRTDRTRRQTLIGIYWAYDGVPNLCAPPRLYNQIAMEIALRRGTSAKDLARLLALINVAMADAGMAIWDSKYFYDFWRPVGGIREADQGTGPTGAGDGNPDTMGDVNFSPLGAPASNAQGTANFTPPFPAYPSGHAGFGGALFQTLRRFYGTDRISFTFVSDEFNGVTRNNQGVARPRIPRRFSSLSQAEEENGQSRIYLGIHWAFDKTEGIAQGRRVANYVFDNAFQPVRRGRNH